MIFQHSFYPMPVNQDISHLRNILDSGLKIVIYFIPFEACFKTDIIHKKRAKNKQPSSVISVAFK